MDEATKAALSEFVQKILSAAQQGAEWTAEQTPILVQEWLKWQIAESALWAIAQFIAVYLLVSTVGKGIQAVVSLICDSSHHYHCNKCTVELDSNNDPAVVRVVILLRSILIVIVGLSFGFPAVYNILGALKAYVAPRVVILEKFADLIK